MGFSLIHNLPDSRSYGLIGPKKGLIVPFLGPIDRRIQTLPLGDALFSAAQQEVLGPLSFGKPDLSFYANEIARWTQDRKGSLMRELGCNGKLHDLSGGLDQYCALCRGGEPATVLRVKIINQREPVCRPVSALSTIPKL